MNFSEKQKGPKTETEGIGTMPSEEKSPVEYGNGEDDRKPRFRFRERREKIDWRKLASVDVVSVIRDVKVTVLQENVSNVTFCDIQAELGDDHLDPNFVKLFRLAQLIIEYLMYSQDSLAYTLSMVEKQNSVVKQKMNTQAKKPKIQLRKHKDTAGVVLIDSATHKCSHCQKVFLNEEFLHMHVQRRHPEHFHDMLRPGNSLTDGFVDELHALKEQLNVREIALINERSWKENIIKENEKMIKLISDMKDEMADWKVEQLDKHKMELEVANNKHLKELKSLNARCFDSEKKLVEMQELLTDYKTNLGMLVDDDSHDNMEDIIAQRQEIESLKEKLSHIEKTIQLKEKPKNDKLDNASDSFQHEYKQEVFKNRLLSDKGDSETDSMKPSFQKFLGHSSHEQLQSITSNVLDFETLEDSDSHLSSNVSVPTKLDFKSIVWNDPNILKGIREEVVNVLKERMDQIGIDEEVNTISDSLLNVKLANQMAFRQMLEKKYSGLPSLREMFESKVGEVTQHS